MPDISKPKIKVYATTVGRRKEAVARVRLIAGNGQIIVNGQPASQYFPGDVARAKYTAPQGVLPDTKKYAFEVKISGGGKSGQLDALVLGLARAISSLKSDNKPALRKLGLLTRDSRIRQRRMVGMGGKSRRRKQSPKR